MESISIRARRDYSIYNLGWGVWRFAPKDDAQPSGTPLGRQKQILLGRRKRPQNHRPFDRNGAAHLLPAGINFFYPRKRLTVGYNMLRNLFWNSGSWGRRQPQTSTDYVRAPRNVKM